MPVGSPDPSSSAIAKLSALTPAEQSVLDQALTGAPARDIAAQLSLSEATVRSHLSSIYLKLGVSGRVALLAAFRGTDMPDVAPTSALDTQITGRDRPLVVSVIAWLWTVMFVAEAAATIYFISWILAAGYAGQAQWLGLFALGFLAVLTLAVSREMRNVPTQPTMLRSIGLAAVYVVLAVVLAIAAALGRSGFETRVPLVFGVLGLVAGWLSFRAWQRLSGP